MHRLLPDFDVDDMPTGAVVGVDYADADAWARIEGATAALSYYDFPKNSRAPVTAR